MSRRVFHPHVSSSIYGTRSRWQVTSILVAILSGALIVGSPFLGTFGLHGDGSVMAATVPSTTQSTTIALTSNDQRLVVVNRESNSVAVIQVRDNNKDVAKKLAEITVGEEPRCVALHPNDRLAFVVNGVSGTVSVVDIKEFKVVAEIPVGTEPRGCALTPHGSMLYVANHTEGTVSIIDTSMRKVVGTAPVGGNPTAIAITNDGDNSDKDERVFVTQIFAELIPNGPGEGRDLGKQGVVHTFTVANPNAIQKITLSPLDDSGFRASRTAFCPGTHPAHIANPILCPRPDLPATDPANVNALQAVHPNQLLSALIRGNRLFLPNIGSQPEPPEAAEVNVQALVYTVNTVDRAEVKDEHVNLNVQINTEPAPADPTTSLARLFGNDIVAIDANVDGSVFLIVSRGGNYVLRASLVGGKLNIGAPDNVVRFQTGNLPDGVVISKSKKEGGKRAYANNAANLSVTAINLEDNTVIERDIPAGEPDPPGTFDHAVLLGKLAFFTALGIPDNGISGTDIRDIVPLTFRGKQSKDGWSSCGSCHPDGLADGVTWFFGTGIRQTKPLDGTFAKDNPDDQGCLNWSCVRGSNTDFNANSRATQGGCGFASVEFTGGIDPPAQCTAANANVTPANPAIHDHGVTQGGSDALDVQTLWIFAAVRPLKQLQPSNTTAFDRGLVVFRDNCASCHGGAKWTKSQIFHRDNPAVDGQNGPPFDPGLERTARLANELELFKCNDLTFRYLEKVGTFDVNNPLELRDNATASTAFGVDGFNPPSLFSIYYHAPYLHRGQAQTLEEVFGLHGLGPDGQVFPPATTIATELDAQQEADLLVFLKAIDGTTEQLRSEGDEFRDDMRTQVPPCPQP